MSERNGWKSSRSYAVLRLHNYDHSEIILTIGYSKTVEAFLKSAWKDRNFTVICAESSPS